MLAENSDTKPKEPETNKDSSKPRDYEENITISTLPKDIQRYDNETNKSKLNNSDSKRPKISFISDKNSESIDENKSEDTPKKIDDGDSGSSKNFGNKDEILQDKSPSNKSSSIESTSLNGSGRFINSVILNSGLNQSILQSEQQNNLVESQNNSFINHIEDSVNENRTRRQAKVNLIQSNDDHIVTTLSEDKEGGKNELNDKSY